MRKIFLFTFIQLILLSGCGGGSNDLSFSSSQTIAGAASNVTTMTVDAGPSGAQGSQVNIPYVTITICAPGSTTNCQTIDHIQVDTGSYGVRIISSVLSSTLLAALPQEMASNSMPLVECTVFGDGYSWGSVRTADVRVSSETASNLPIQVIGDPNFPNIPSVCQHSGPQEEDTVEIFGANGIIGVGPFVQDCGEGCVDSTANGFYWSCPTGGGTCQEIQVTLAQQTANPVASFTTDNNGVILELPSISDAGSLTVTGALVFGIGTESNNALGSATVLTADTSGYITVTYKGTAFPDGFLDSGSNLDYFNDTSIRTCSISNQPYFCPTSELSLSTMNEGTNNVTSTVNLKIADASTQFTNNPTFTAFDNIGAPGSDPQGFDFGLPFFYSRNVFVALDGMNTSGGLGPYFAY